MAEENGNAEVSVETPPAPLVDENGVLREGWLEKLDEDLRGESYLKEVKDVQGMARSVINARRMVGRDKIAIPTTDEEWNVFHKVGGRPDTVADYNLVKPEDFPEEHYSQDLANAAMELFHKIGISKKQAEALFEFNNNNALVALKAKQDADAASYKEVEDALYKDWGNAYEQNKHLGNVAIEQAVTKDGKVNEELKVRLVEKFGNDPDFIRAFSNLGAKFAEHGDVAIPGIPTPGDIQAKIDDEMAHKSYSPDYAKHGFTKAQHKAQVEKVYRMREELIKATKTG
jgi:hypothetical protein